ncbi:MAG: electron transfer flavoprotein subunit alpha/FixB family protein [Actinomyces graevenitzii]|nr:electron transfer flavoprotein subunit alpha/FixB family protein [Actinomyces graevenitzii]
MVSAAGADAVIAAAHEVKPALILLGSDHRAKEIAGRAAVKLASACIADAACLEVVDQHVRASKLVLSGSWNTTFDLRADSGANPPLVCLRAGAVEAEPCGGAAAQVETLAVSVSQAAKRVEVVSHTEDEAAAGPQLAQARTVVVGGRGVDGDFDLVRSLAQLLNGAVGATRVACDEGWIERSAQVGQTGETIAPRLYIGLGVSGAVHHTSGIQGAGTIVAICDDSEAPIFEMADFGVVGDVSTVVPQLIEELAKTR